MSQSKDVVFEKLSWNDILDWAGDTIASRGRSYQHEHRVRELAGVPSGGVVAWVEGTESYATLVNIEDGELTAVCSCPYGDVCKHAVAVVLEYTDQLRRNMPVPAVAQGDRRLAILESESAEAWDEVDEDVNKEDIEHIESKGELDGLHAYLEKQSKAELIKLLEDLSRRQPAVHDSLQDRYHLLKGDTAKLVKALRKEIDKLGDGYQQDWRGDWNYVDPDYSGIRERMVMLLENGQADEVVNLGKRMLEAGTRQVETVNDEGESAEEIASCMDIVFKALSKSSLPPAEQMLWAAEAELQDEYDLCNGASVFWEQPHAANDWNILADRLLQRLNKFGASKNEDGDSRDYRRDRLTDWVITALENAGRVDEIIPLCEKEAEKTKSYVRLVNYLVEQGLSEAAERWIRKGIKATQASLPGIASRLHDMLGEMRKREGDWAGVAALRADDFFANPSLESFKNLQKSAERVGVWSAVHAAAMHFLKTGELPAKGGSKSPPDVTIPPWPLPETGVQKAITVVRKDFPLTGTLIDIAIAEKKADEVLHWYDVSAANRFRYGTWFQADRIAQAIAEAYPERAVGIWKKLAEDCIARTQPKAYEEARDYLLCVRNSLEITGKADEWRGYLTGLYQKNARKRRLIEILDSLDKRNPLR